ncbi:Tricorn protease homolog [Tenacibaculum litopenaei]|uniref:S41 family peptidase n=1 Tax=Tenacibaculum litopenaei TaxID=396016 RepID=UPI0038944C0C
MLTRKLLAVAMLFCSGLLTAQTTFIRKPSLSPDGSKLAFSYHGDIWVYTLATKDARRLTIHEAYESDPVWNDDGSEIAFSSNRTGNTNVFTVAVNGGRPKQLTYYPTSNVPSDWYKDEVVFTTNRVLKGPEWDAQMYQVEEKGGTPTRLLTALGSQATISPDGKFIAYVKGACRIAREDYTGSAQRDIWIFNTQTKQYHQITTSVKNDHTPRWDAAGNLYYIGAESGRYNIYKQAISSQGTKSGVAKQLTKQRVDGVRTFGIANDGKIVYASGATTYLFTQGSSKKLQLSLGSDAHFDEEDARVTSGGIRNYSISPDAKLVAMEIEGDVFVKLNNKEKKRSNPIGQGPSRDKNPQWISNKKLFFISDRDGQFEIYSATSSDSLVGLNRSLKVAIAKETKSKQDVERMYVSPDQKKIAYQVGRGTLYIADIKDGAIKNPKIYSDTWAAPEDLSWSPDSKYIAYSQEDLNFDSEIFIQSVADPKVKMNVSMHPRSDSSPVWSADGKKLAFLSNRSGINYDVWMLWLQKEDWEKSRIDHEEGDYYASKEATSKKSKKAKKGKKGKKKKTVKVKIDADKIYDRLVQVTRLQDNEYSVLFSPDSKYIYFSATNPATQKRNLYKVKWDGSKPKAVRGSSRVGNFSVAKGKIYLTASGRLKQMNPKSDKLTSLPHSARIVRDLNGMRAQVFDEGIRALTDGFYDPEFHGYNWKSLVKKYRPWVLSTSTQQDFSYVFNLLLGQLNASHMGYASRNPEKVASSNIGLIGLEVVPVKDGVKVTYVLPNSAADKTKSKLKAGDVIVAVNGKPIKKHSNFYSYLKNTRNSEVLLQLKGGKDVVLRTLRSLRGLQYDAWVESRKELVAKYSNGQLGYIHIQGMNMPSFERFERELKASGYGKKGIVIDVRYNGGGWTTDRLMAVLNVQQHAYTIPRGATKSLKNHKSFTKNYPFNERAILSVNTKPVVALCNENSYSNAEIFSHAFKNLGLGKLVGQPTFGAVISTGGRSLQNGFIRMPFRAWYVKKSGKNMENEAPATPDYLVKNAPGSKDRGEDAQLKKAVEVLLQEL